MKKPPIPGPLVAMAPTSPTKKGTTKVFIWAAVIGLAAWLLYRHYKKDRDQ